MDPVPALAAVAKKAAVVRKRKAAGDADTPAAATGTPTPPPYKAPKVTKLSVRAANEECEPIKADLAKFWASVSEEALEEVAHFCVAHPKLLKWWMEDKARLYAGVPGFDSDDAGPMLKYVGLGNVPYKQGRMDQPCLGFAGLALPPPSNPTFRAGSMAVLYSIGMDVPDSCMPSFLRRLFAADLQGHPVIARHMPDIKKRLGEAIKVSPAMLERVLHAAAVNANLHMFHAFAPSKGKGVLFHVLPGAADSVLQAVLTWPDPKIRHELASMVLTRSSTAYVMQHCLPQSALAQAALTPDPEMLTMIIIRLQADGVMDQYLDDIGTLTCKVIQVLVSSPDAPPALAAAYATVQTKLAALLDEQHLSQLRGHLDTLRENAIRCKLAADVTHPLHQQATGVIDMLTRVTAGCVAAVHMCAELDWRHMERNAVRTKAEEDLFQERFRGHLKQIQFDTDTQQANTQLVARIYALEEQREQQRQDLQAIQAQAAVIARLRRQLAAASTAEAKAEATEEGTLAELSDVMEVMETRLLLLRLPLAPTAAAVAAPVFPRPIGIALPANQRKP